MQDKIKKLEDIFKYHNINFSESEFSEGFLTGAVRMLDLMEAKAEYVTQAEFVKEVREEFEDLGAGAPC